MEFLVAGSVTTTVRVGARSVPGAGRRHNEDAFLAGPTWFVVADGVGGHDAGGTASGMVRDLLSQRPAPGDLTDVASTIDELDAAIHRRDRRDTFGPMATTLVGVVLAGGSVTVFHVGDSRCYRLGDSGLQLLTRDHSYVQELVDAGLISSEDARSHRGRNVITRALGAAASAAPEVRAVSSPAGRLLLCSDGVSATLADHSIEQVLAEVADPQQAADRLVSAAVRAGSRDDATTLVVDGLGAP